MTKNRKGVASRIAQETANLRKRPREAEAGVKVPLRKRLERGC
jgi:hypothetical protein